MSCLIIKNDGVGDLILASGLISELGKYFGGNVDLVTCSLNKEIAEGIKPLRNCFYVSRDDLRYIKKKKRFLKKYYWAALITDEDKLVLDRIAGNKYEVAICLRRFIRASSLIIMSYVHATKKYCSWQFPTNISLDLAQWESQGWVHIKGEAEPLSELSYNKAFLEKILGLTINPQPRLSFSPKNKSTKCGQKIAIGIAGKSSNWPESYWFELTRQLYEAGWETVLLGGNDAQILAARLKYLLRAIDDQTGRLSWQETAEVMGTCDAYIGNDTGLSHLASLIVEKCLVILGGGTFRRFFPWPETNVQHIIYHGLDCFDCVWKCKWQSRKCLDLVHPDSVINALNRMMKEDIGTETNLNSIDKEYQLSWRILQASKKRKVNSQDELPDRTDR